MEWLTTLPPEIWALLGTVLGGTGLKIVERFLNRDVALRDDRRDLREEVKELYERVEHLEDEVTAWRDRYYAGQEQILMLKAMVIGAGIQIPEDA